MLFDTLAKKGKEFLGVEYPILGGAMSWISDSKLTAAISNAGGFGVLAGGSMPPEMLVEEVKNTRKLTDKNFGINLVTVSPAFNDQLDAVLEINPKYLVFAGGLPSRDAIEKVQKHPETKLMAFAPNHKIAQRLAKLGVDAIIIEGQEAGGHVGNVSTLVLIQKVLFNVTDIPVFVAGGIATGKMIAHLILMGAAGVQLGTRFVLTKEAAVHERMQQMFIRANARDAAVSFGVDPRLPVIPVRALKNKGTVEFTKLQLRVLNEIERGEISREQGAHKVEEYWLGALKRAARDGDTEFGSLMAGQAVGLFDKVTTVKEALDELVKDSEQEFELLKNTLKDLV
jgi:enoyl-[acyl-carrier protein] reductase II